MRKLEFHLVTLMQNMQCKAETPLKMWAGKYTFHTVPIVFILHLPQISVLNVQVEARKSQGDNWRLWQLTGG